MDSPSLLSRLAPSVTSMIRMDHSHVITTFHQYDPGASDRVKKGLADQVCVALEIHAQLEEEIFYPALRAVADTEMLRKSTPEHDEMRGLISRLPFGLRKRVTDVIAATIYWPLARTSGALERLGVDVANAPLSFYRRCSFYTMRTDALDRFGTRLEQRFSRVEIEALMRRSGLVDIRFSDAPPYWVACGRRAGP